MEDKNHEVDDPPAKELLEEDGKNSTSIYCRVCGSLILQPRSATYQVTPVSADISGK
jgi:hypothetical protein